MRSIQALLTGYYIYADPGCDVITLSPSHLLTFSHITLSHSHFLTSWVYYDEAREKSWQASWRETHLMEGHR